MGTEEAAVAGGIVGGMLVSMSAFLFIFWILLIIARWKIFTKAGEAGWKSIIPIYADYIQWRIGWNKINLFWVMLACVFVGCLIMSFGGYQFGADSAVAMNAATMNMPLVGIGSLIVLAGGILELIAVYKLFQSFGWGAGMFVLYIFFAPIILMVLGFGSQRYFGAVD